MLVLAESKDAADREVRASTCCSQFTRYVRALRFAREIH
jgi:hypothetical protein